MKPEEEALGREINLHLKKAMENGDPACEEARVACEKNKEWLLMSWPPALYSAETHMQLVESYAANDKMRRYYDAEVGPGAAEFFIKAMRRYLADDLDA